MSKLGMNFFDFANFIDIALEFFTKTRLRAFLSLLFIYPIIAFIFAVVVWGSLFFEVISSKEDFDCKDNNGI